MSPIHVSAGRKRGDFRIYLQSPMGTRTTLLDARPQDYSSSGFMDWPFMSVHSWGEDPRGTWTLEVHNDAFSKWASDAKFFKWTLELYGTEFDPNSEEYRRAHKERFNVVRDVKEDIIEDNTKSAPPTTTAVPPTTVTTTTTTTTATTTTTSTRNLRGCVSKQGECTRDASQCRTFAHRSVARVLCKCTSQCQEIGTTFGNGDEDEPLYNMQCQPLEARSSSNKEDKKPPVFCQFITFLS